MTDKFPRKYDIEIENEINKLWLDNQLFNPETVKKLKKSNFTEKFIIALPPPNVTGSLHIGHASMLSIEDIMVRFARMKGKYTLWIPGTDHAGISTQVVVEKKLAKEFKIDRHSLGREKFIEKIWEWVKISRSSIVSQIKRMGSSVDWSREQFTVSEKLSRAVRKSFSNLYKKGKIYQSTYIINWCIRCQTVLSDLETVYKEQKSNLYFIRYFIEGKGEYITIATVRPETIFADVAIAVNPRDKRYKKLIGKNVLIPIINKPIPIISDESVDMGFGTGALKITPAHDEVDFRIGVNHNLPLDQFAIDKNGNLTEIAGIYANRSVEDVFENIIRYLKDIGNIQKIEQYDTSIPQCERCGTRIQPLISKQWFVDVNQSAKDSINSVNINETKIYPERFNKIFFNWLNNIKPWCISRQLWWGHRIPVWTCYNGHNNVFDEDNVIIDSNEKNFSILSMIIFNLIADSRLANPFNIEQLINILIDLSLTPQEGNIYKVYLSQYKYKYEKDKEILHEINELEKILNSFKKDSNEIIKLGGKIIDILDSSKNILKKSDLYYFEFQCLQCGKTNLIQDTDVLDTWFSSGLRPFSILGWPENTPDFNDFYPNNVLETGYDIIFFWVARMMFMGFENIGQTPFKNIYLHGIVRDENGDKMSKTKGNVIDPLEIISTYGADALRLSLISGSTPGNDLKFSATKVDYNSRFLNKLWNASRYIYIKVLDGTNITLDYDLIRKDLMTNIAKLNDFDKWIISKLNDLIKESEKSMEKFMIGEFAQTAISIVWHNFCDWYIEISKYQKSDYSDKVLLYSIGTILKLLHPYIPFITEKIWRLLGFEGFLIISDYPEIVDNIKNDLKLDLLIEIVGEFRNLRQNIGFKPHEKCDSYIQSNTNFIDFVKDYDNLLKIILNIENLFYLSEEKQLSEEYSSSVVVNVKIGIKGEKTINWEEKIKKLQLQLNSEKQFLQNIRNLLSGPGFLEKAPAQVIEEKTKKMEEVKLKILNIENEINKIKINKK